MESILKKLEGKKGVLATLFTATAGFVYAKGYIDDITYGFICTIIATIFGTASYQTNKMYK